MPNAKGGKFRMHKLTEPQDNFIHIEGVFHVAVHQSGRIHKRHQAEALLPRRANLGAQIFRDTWGQVARSVCFSFFFSSWEIRTKWLLQDLTFELLQRLKVRVQVKRRISLRSRSHQVSRPHLRVPFIAKFYSQWAILSCGRLSQSWSLASLWPLQCAGYAPPRTWLKGKKRHIDSNNSWPYFVNRTVCLMFKLIYL